MPENPYAPPTSEVADVESENRTMERPRIVTQGIGLLWLYLAISVPTVILDGFVAPPPIEDDPDGTLRTFQTVGTVVSIVLIAVMALLTWFAWKGRNWARITHLVLVIVGVLMSGLAMVVSYWMAPEEEIFSRRVVPHRPVRVAVGAKRRGRPAAVHPGRECLVSGDARRTRQESLHGVIRRG